MSDSISRQEAINAFDIFTTYEANRTNEDWVKRIKVVLSSLPSAEKTGHWVEENIDKWSRKTFCSECGCSPPFEYVSDGDVYSANGHGVINKTKFCPNCGAKMVEREK